MIHSVALIDRHGDVAYVYSKVHTCVWGADEAMTAPGRHFFTGSIDIGSGRGNVTFGSMICADREFPESARLLALHGAEVLLVPNACGLVPAQLRQFRTRAVENVLTVTMANYANDDGNGLSVAYDHEGVELASGAEHKEEMVIVDVDVTALRAARGTQRGAELLKHRPAPQLCEIARQAAFTRQNVFDRVGGSVY